MHHEPLASRFLMTRTPRAGWINLAALEFLGTATLALSFTSIIRRQWSLQPVGFPSVKLPKYCYLSNAHQKRPG